MHTEIDIRRVTLFSDDLTYLLGRRAYNEMRFEFDKDFNCIRTDASPNTTTNTLDICREAALKELKSKLCVHYIAEAGFNVDEAPVYCAPFDNMAGAVEQLRALYELSDGEVKILLEDCHIELEVVQHGVGYVAIEECACDDGDEHEN